MPRITGIVTLSAIVSISYAATQGKPNTNLSTQQTSPTERSARVGSAFYEQHIRPLFSAKCNTCHSGPKAAAGLNLAKPSGWLAVVRNGKLLQALQHKPSVAAMPPSGIKVSERELEGVAAWIKLGAPGPLVGPIAQREKHWSFQGLKQNAPLANIDNLIDNALAAVHLTRNPPASRTSLIRRATLDLTGLPPTPAEVQDFIDDKKPGSFERVVDRLLASTHFGEKWARHWLDVARFAESHGYEQDYDRPHAWTYRDAVIRAFNNNLPWNTFVAWQLAGDEIAPENPEALFATGFLGAGTHATQITKNQVEKERYDELDDMLSVTSQAFLGLTVGCARCHNHKFDPISQRDYYAMLSTFTKTVRSDQDVETDAAGHKARLVTWEKEHIPLLNARTQWETTQLEARFAQWKASPTTRKEQNWSLPTRTTVLSAGGATISPLPDGSQRITGKNPDSETLTFTLDTKLTKLTAIRIEALADDGLVGRGPGRASNGNFALSNIRVRVGPPAVGLGGLKIVRGQADFEQGGLPVAAAFDADLMSGWAIDNQFGKDHVAVFTFENAAAIAPGFPVVVTLEFNVNTGHGMGRPRISLTDHPNAPLVETPIPTTEDGLRAWYKTTDPEWQALNRTVDTHAATKPTPTVQRGMICSEGVVAIRTHTQGGDFLEQTHFLNRGDPNNKGDVMAPGFLTILAKPRSDQQWSAKLAIGGRSSGNRRAFTEWMLDTQHGAGDLVARVAVNRVWHHLFGRGIVGTPSDFGTTGERPTHPVLLDRLALDFQKSGWKIKDLIRQVILSKTYRQSGALSIDKQQRDPDNRWLSRFAPRPLEAENLRDAILAVSGELDASLFGPGTMDAGMKRRSIYFFIKRSRLNPFLMAFDAPNALQSVGTRQTTTVAPQALVLMNNPNIRAWCDAFARRAEVAGNPDATIQAIFKGAITRSATGSELKDSRAYLKSGGTVSGLCQIVFSLNEFAYVQ